mgnify:CR=1 FL=1
MGSVFVTQEDRTVKGFLGKEYSVPFYLQFVPGYCVDVVHSEASSRFNTDKSINSIIAIPHISDKLYKKRASAGEDSRYFPLFRTFNDVPTKGDPVLLCTIGNINYYLGPLNTINNSPTWNDDPSYSEEFAVNNNDMIDASNVGERGESTNFVKTNHSRIQKRFNETLEIGQAINETNGDTILEGRHGNSLRVGSAGAKPYIFISNNRDFDNKFESLGDGSLISITANSTLSQHFPVFADILNNENKFGFQLSSDGVENNTYPIGDIYSDLNNNGNVEELIYGYNKNQILFHSDRITLNSKLDDIFVSSIKDIHIGAGRHISIGAFESLNILSSNVNIGNSERAFEMQPMVLGESLKEVLNDIVALFSKIQVMTQLGPQNILPTTQIDIQEITNKIDTITSAYHNIEGN